MASKIGHQIEDLRYKLGMNQTDFGKLFKTTAMSVSRWERDINPPSSHELLKLGVLARKVRMNGWMYWELAGLTRADAKAALSLAKSQGVAVGRG